MNIEMEMKKNHVCFVSPKAYPLFNPAVESVFGGAEVDVYMIATELAKDENFSVSAIVADYGQPEEEMRQNVRVLKSLKFGQNAIAGARKIWQALKQADADIYLLKTASAGVPLVQYFCRKYRRKFVYRTAHQDECNGAYVKKQPFLGRLFIRSLKTADLVLAQNKSDAASLRSLYGIDAVMIPNAHRLPDTSDRPRKWILWVGRSADFKHPERFLKLAKQFPQEPFVMVCQKATGDKNYDKLQSDAKKIANLTFLERVDFCEIDDYFEQAKIFVNTSGSEGFANTFIQACKAGTVILSYAVNPDGFLDEYRCGVVCGGKEEVLAEKLQCLLDNDRYVEWGRRGQAHVRQKHDITAVIEQYKHYFTQQAKS